jgi:hypothetical protein
VSSLLQRSRQGPRRWLLRLAVVLVAGVAALVWFARSQPEPHLTIENRSGQPVPELQVTVAGQSTTFRDVATGARVSSPTVARDGDTFAVEGQLADGRRVRMRGTISKATHLLLLPGGDLQFERPGRASLRWPGGCRWTAVAIPSPACPT